MALAGLGLFDTWRFNPAQAGVFGTDFKSNTSVRRSVAPPISGGFGAALSSPDQPARSEMGGGDKNTSTPSARSTASSTAPARSPGAKEAAKAPSWGTIGGVIGGLVGGPLGGALGKGIGLGIDSIGYAEQMESLGLRSFGLEGFGKAVVDSMLMGAPGWGYSQQMQDTLAAVWDTDIANAMENFGPPASWDTDIANAAENFTDSGTDETEDNDVDSETGSATGSSSSGHGGGGVGAGDPGE